LKDLSSVKRISALILVIAMLTGLCSCRQKPDGEEETTLEDPALGVSFTVAYDRDDGINPFFIETTVNEQLISLMHRGLYSLDTTFSVNNDIAADENIKGNTVEVALSEVRFSDGQTLTAEDVVYSFVQAKASPLYESLLSSFTDCSAKNSSTVIFTMSDRNINALMSLTFPVVKRLTADKRDSKPIGCGPYAFNMTYLTRNPNYGKTLPAEKIILEENISSDSYATLVDTGELSFYYDNLSSGETTQSSSPSTAVYLNNLIYLGLNGGNKNLAVSSIRKAISCAIDRRNIVDSAMQGNGRPASVPFNTSWAEFSASATAIRTDDLADKTKARKLLTPFGVYAEQLTEEVTDENGEVTVSEAQPAISFSLIHPDSNTRMFAVAKLIQQQLLEVGIGVEVVAVPSEDYLTTIQDGGYDMYIGEINIPANMDISALMSAYGNAGYGISYYLMDCDEYYIDYVQGDVTMDDFLEVFLEEQPFIPLCYRNGRFFSSKDTSVSKEISESGIYRSISEWSLIG